jgi:hypothetical protein
VSDYDLRGAVREALAKGGCDSFREYAQRVLDDMPESAYRAVILATLPDFIRDLDRRDAGRVTPPRIIQGTGSTGGHASVHVDGVGLWWDRILARQIITPGGITKPLADATCDEVRFYAGMLRVKGMETLQTADGFDRIADLMKEQKVATARDLPSHLGSVALQKVKA